MSSYANSSARRAFSLMEFLTLMVVGIVLLGGLLGCGESVNRKAKKNKALMKLRLIGQGYLNWAQGGKVMTRDGTWVSGGNVATKVSEYAANLAADPALNSSELWFVDGDAMLEMNPVSLITLKVIRVRGATTAIDPAFIADIAQGTATSWTVYSGTSKSLEGSVGTPLAWSRGLSNVGTWPVADGTNTGSVWGTEGGHIVYGDGHVSWCTDTMVTGADYFSDRNGIPTANWLQSRGVPATAQALPQQ